MCGIAGIYNLNDERTSSLEALYNMAQAMHHRGPDGEGYFFAYKNNKRGQFHASIDESSYSTRADVFIAHKRLSIVDLSLAASQPMATEDQRFWITYNGELYNYQVIAKELEQLGVYFRSHSDTEVVLKAYRQWGAAALKKFNGMFAFAIWDEHEKTLFCARDRIGIKPFYYTVQYNQFIFASDIKTLIASGLYKPTVNPEGLYHTLSFGVAPRPMTCFQDVYALPQSHWMLIKPSGDIHFERYWHIPIGTQDKTLSEGDAKALLDEKLTQAVKRRLVADVPVGTFMSGGIDSTLISAKAAALHPGIKAFTLGYEGYAAKYDEVPQARATAAMHPLQHIVERIDVDSILTTLEDNIRFGEEPYYSLSPNYLISRLVSNHQTTVILNGLGGDELFAGYRYYRWANRRPLMKAIAPLFKPFKYRKELYARVSEFSEAKSMSRYYHLLFTTMSEHTKQRLFNSDVFSKFNTIERLHELYMPETHSFTDNIEAISYMDLMHYIGNHHVYRIDQDTMAFSLESRFPFLDHEVIETAFRIPSKYKICNGQQKYILREVAKSYIAPECLSMKKKGFSLPMKHWMNNALSDYTQQRLLSLGKRDMFNDSAIKEIWHRFKAGSIQGRYVWQLVALEGWLQMFID